MIQSPPIAQFRHKVTVETPTKVSDGQGGFTRTGWTTYLSAYAFIDPLSANQRIFAGQNPAETSHKVWIRYRRDKTVTTEMRVNYTVGSTTRYFKITGVINVEERNRFVTLMCKEGVGT